MTSIDSGAGYPWAHPCPIQSFVSEWFGFQLAATWGGNRRVILGCLASMSGTMPSTRPGVTASLRLHRLSKLARFKRKKLLAIDSQAAFRFVL